MLNIFIDHEFSEQTHFFHILKTQPGIKLRHWDAKTLMFWGKKRNPILPWFNIRDLILAADIHVSISIYVNEASDQLRPSSNLSLLLWGQKFFWFEVILLMKVKDILVFNEHNYNAWSSDFLQFQAWSWDQYWHHHLEACWKFRFSGPLQTYCIRICFFNSIAYIFLNKISKLNYKQLS